MSWKYDCTLYFIIHNSARWEFEAWLHFYENIHFVVNLLGRQSTWIHTLVFNFRLFSSLTSSIYIPDVTFFLCVPLSRLYEFHCCIDYSNTKRMNCNLSCCDVGVVFTLLFILHHYRSLWNLCIFFSLKLFFFFASYTLFFNLVISLVDRGLTTVVFPKKHIFSHAKIAETTGYFVW